MRRSVLLAGSLGALAAGATVIVAAASYAGTSGTGYEAEAAGNRLTGIAQRATCRPCSGGQRVGWIGFENRLTFHGVMAARSGSVTVHVSYSSPDERQARLRLNEGGNVLLSFPPTGSAERTGTLDVTLRLRTGENLLTFSNPSAWAPDIDKLTVDGQEGDAPEPTVTAPEPTASQTAPVPTTPPVEHPTGNAALETEVARLVNVERAATGCDPLTVDSRLRAAARKHSADMAAKNYFSHTSQDGTEFADRITREDYGWSGAGENIAKGQRTPADVMNSWMNSPGHRANILNCGFRDIGVGVAADAQGSLIWTQDFASS
jgi:uncharacterized protein YkwD